MQLMKYIYMYTLSNMYEIILLDFSISHFSSIKIYIMSGAFMKRMLEQNKTIHCNCVHMVSIYSIVGVLQMIKNFHGQIESIKESAAIKIAEARR